MGEVQGGGVSRGTVLIPSGHATQIHDFLVSGCGYGGNSVNGKAKNGEYAPVDIIIKE